MTIPVSARNTISIAHVDGELHAVGRAGRDRVEQVLARARQGARRVSPAVSGWSISGMMSLATASEAGADITLQAIRCPAMPGTLSESITT